MGFEGFSGESPERNETLLEDIDSMWAWLIEKGSEDKAKSSQVRQLLYQHLNKLGVVNTSGYIDMNSWSDFVTAQAQRKNSPVRPANYPDLELFSQKLEEYSQSNPKVNELNYHT